MHQGSLWLLVFLLNTTAVVLQKGWKQKQRDKGDHGNSLNICKSKSKHMKDNCQYVIDLKHLINLKLDRKKLFNVRFIFQCSQGSKIDLLSKNDVNTMVSDGLAFFKVFNERHSWMIMNKRMSNEKMKTILTDIKEWGRRVEPKLERGQISRAHCHLERNSPI